MASSPITYKRSANFSPQEESLLVSLTKKHEKVLECKLTDTNANEEKRKEWGRIETEFNSMSGESYRAQDVLRRKYDNIKKRSKIKYSEEKCYPLGTGGGPQELKIKKSTDKQIGAISDRVLQWTEARWQLQQSHCNFAEKEHELKLKLMQDKHDREMCIMEKEAELKRKLMIEESQARISIMKSL